MFMVQLTAEQAKELKETGDPPRVAVGDTEYVLVRLEVYDKARVILEREPEEIDPSFYEFTDIQLSDQSPR